MIASASGLGIVDAVLLGLIEGATEFLPVSSTGHLLVAQRMLGLGGTASQDRALDAYAICIQGGAILAVVALYRRRIGDIANGALGRSTEGRRLLSSLVVAFAPAALLGLLLADAIKSALFGVGPVAAAWLVGGVVILVAQRRGWTVGGSIELDSIRPGHALVIGAAQALALWPGVSRSLVTIMAALLVGCTVRAAVEFSFLLGLVTLSAASAYEVVRSGGEIVRIFGLITPTVGLLVATVAAVVSIRWLVRWVEVHGLATFGYYRVVIGIAGLVIVGGT
ncbi:MAG: undecaprenyl-diphosphate phosphatase [Acidimicrobiales bacterium]|nr:undecaprenyl-diphosphate phosphatase [Acidimicrobiales bacterium]